jgi:hypothetical protein
MADALPIIRAIGRKVLAGMALRVAPVRLAHDSSTLARSLPGVSTPLRGGQSRAGNGMRSGWLVGGRHPVGQGKGSRMGLGDAIAVRDRGDFRIGESTIDAAGMQVRAAIGSATKPAVARGVASTGGEGRRSLVAARRKQAIAKTTRQASPPTDHPKLRRIDPSKEPRASAREVHRQTIAPPKTQYWPRPHRPADRTTFGSVDPYPRPAAGGFSNGQVDSDRPPGPTARPKPGSALPRNILVTPQGGTGAISPPPASRSSDSRAVAQNPMKQFSEKPNYSSISALITSW